MGSDRRKRQIRNSAIIATIEARISVRCGPAYVATTYCVTPKMMPVTEAGITAVRSVLTPPMAKIMYAGTMRATGAHIAATAELSSPRGSPVVAASVISGVPIDPNATGAVLASRQMAEARKGEKPRPLNIAAAIATGVPKPAAPSIKAPSAKAMRSACEGASLVSRPIDSRMMSNLPVTVVMRKRTIAQKMIHEIGNRPNAAP